MPAIFEHRLTVAPGHIDRLGHVNNLEYLRWALAAAVRHSAAQGWPAEAYERLGAAFVVRSHEIQYLQPAYEGDEIVVRTWVADFRRLSCLRRYKIIRTSGRRRAGHRRHAMGLCEARLGHADPDPA